MQLSEIQSRLESIRTLARDRNLEGAHIEEDRLHESVLHAIATGTCEDPQAAAALALSSQTIPFYRACGL